MIGTQIAYNPNKPQRVKHWVRYHATVTVCIAVACQEQDEPRIVLCSDTRLDYEYLGSTNLTCKLDVLGYGWCCQMAGHWSGVQELCAILKRKVQKSPRAPRASELATAAQKSVAEFLKSPLYQNDQTYQLLLSGFDQKSPVIIDVSVYPQDFKIEYKVGFGAIGSGFQIASTLLLLRECNPQMPLSHATYLAYEAKRGSEKVGDVGRFTALLVQAPCAPEAQEKTSALVVGQLGIENLEELYRKFWRVPFTNLIEIPEFPPEFFTNPKVK